MKDCKAKVVYRFKTDKGDEYQIISELVETDSPYGNSNYVWITEPSGHYYNLDARWDRRFDSADGFYKNILDVLKDRYNIAEYELIEKE